MIRALAIVLAIALATVPAHAQAPATLVEMVFVVKPGKTPLKAEPKLDAPSKGVVGYGQKLAVVKKGEGWVFVSVPGETAQGWINVKSVVDKRPGLDTLAVAGAGVKVAASETGSTAGAIRGLDGRTAGYASAKQIPPEALSQLGRLEAHGERIFRDPHSVDAKGVWRYKDATAAGRLDAAKAFAKDEGLKVSRPSTVPSAPRPATPTSPTPTPLPMTPAAQPAGTPAP